MTTRRIAIVAEPETAEEAEGVTIRRSIGGGRLILLDPVLLLDHLTLPAQAGAGGPVGFPRHPHRGIETLTYVFAGNVHHKDSLGNDSAVGANGSQWMTAGGGIFHEEYLEAGPDGCEALQIWFNLPAAEKMKPAGYRPAHAGDIPEVSLGAGATARVVAGESDGTQGAFQGIAARPTYLDVRLSPKASVALPAPPDETTLAYVVRGEVAFGAGDEARAVSAPHLVLFSDGDAVQATARDAEARFVFVSAKPLREPVMQYRSIVLNTPEQMRQALEDLENGTFARP